MKSWVALVFLPEKADLEDKSQYYHERINSLVGLPTLPTIALEIQSIMREDKLSVVQTIPIIEQDPSLAMKILKVANSAFYGMQEQVNSLRQAVVIIGMRELAGIVLGFSVLKSLTNQTDADAVDWKRFWEHSIAVGHISELLDEELGTRLSESLYSLGLLHDIGQLVLFRLEPEKYNDVYKLSQYDQISMLQAEESVFGISHEQAGQWIAEKWGLSDMIQCVNGYHHNLSGIHDGELRMTTAIVSLANIIAHTIRMNFGYSRHPNQDDIPEAWEIIQERSVRAQKTEYNEFLLDLDGHWGAVREMVKLLKM